MLFVFWSSPSRLDVVTGRSLDLAFRDSDVVEDHATGVTVRGNAALQTQGPALLQGVARDGTGSEARRQEPNLNDDLKGEEEAPAHAQYPAADAC